MKEAQSTATRAEEIAHVINAHLPEEYQAELRQEAERVEQKLAERRAPRRRVLLVGGAGYVGSVVTAHLLDRGYTVRLQDLLLYENETAVYPYLSHPEFEFEYGDLADPADRERALDGVTDVVLLAGLVGDPITKKFPEESAAVNDRGVADFLADLDGRGLERVLFISTCSNYGLVDQNVAAAEDHPLAPLSAYARSKVARELELIALKATVDYTATILRFATAFGLSPRMRFDLTVNEFAREMYLGRELLVYDAETWRPYCHVQDFAEAIRRVIEAPRERIDFETFNIGSNGNNWTKEMLVSALREHFPETPVRYQQHGGDPRNYRVNFDKARRLLHFEAAVSVEDGLEELIGALRNHLFDRVEERPTFYGNYEVKYPGVATASAGS